MGEQLKNLKSAPKLDFPFVESKKLWDKLTKELSGLGILNSISLELLENYCNLYGIQKKALEEIKEEGLSDGLKKNPALTAYLDAGAQMRQISVKFGFTPSDASRIKLPGKKDDKDPFDEI